MTKTSSKPKMKVGIVGSYGGLNLGDEAILRSIITQLRRSYPVEITVFSRNADDTLARHPVDKAVQVREKTRDEILPEVQALDLLIVGGGGIFFDAEAHIFLREAVLAQEVGVPVMVYAVSAGPLNQARARELVRDTLNRAAVVTVRERTAQKLLEEIGVDREIHLVADPALLLEPEPLPEDALVKEGFVEGKRYVGLSVRELGPAAPDLDEKHYLSLLANTADFIVERYDAEVVFVPMERNNLDMQLSHAIISQMANAQRATVLKGDYTSGQVVTLMKSFEFAVGMRLHFLIFAAIQRVPFVALPYAGKVKGFLEDLQISAPPMERVNPGRLIAYIDRSWDLRREIQDQIERLLPAVQERSRETNKLVLQALKAPVSAR